MLPEAPAELVNELSRRYIMLYELITGQTFAFPDLPDQDPNVLLKAKLGEYFSSS